MTTTNAAPKILDLPIGHDVTGTRRESDSLGDVEVPADRYRGAQTQRSLEHFNIGRDRMPAEVYHAYGFVKKAAALVNTRVDRVVDPLALTPAGLPDAPTTPKPTTPKPIAPKPTVPRQA
jgi:hypothetical protein